MYGVNRPFQLVVFGISHRSAPFEQLERAALSREQLKQLYAQLAESEQIRDAFVVSTCNRTELYASGDAEQECMLDLLRSTFDRCVSGLDTAAHCYSLGGLSAIEHLFRVVSGLDSMMLGENQIVGQMRQAYEEGTQTFPASPHFERMIQGAFRAAARARAESEIAQGAVSVASAAVHLASRIFSDISRRHVVILGAGSTGRLAAQHFSKLAPKSITILNRTLAKAQLVAREVGGTSAPLDELDTYLAKADVVTCAVTANEALLDRVRIERALEHHHSGSLALLDLGLPRNVDPAANELPNVFVHDLQALEKMVDGNLERRKSEIPKVEEIIKTEIAHLEEWQRATQAGPLIQALRQSVEHMRTQEVNRVTRNMNDEQRAAVDRATRAVVNKLLHGPTQHIKEAAKAPGEHANRLSILNDVFQSLTEGRPSRDDN